MTVNGQRQDVAVVTDSLAWLPEPVAKEYNIRIVPLHVHFGTEQYTETVDITTREFYQRLRSGVSPKTSQPAVGEFLAAYREAGEQARAILSVHASSKLSGTCNAATTAAALFREERPDIRIETLDTRQIATAQGIVAVQAARLAASGASFESIVAGARDLMPKTRVLLMVESLEYLRRGGRIGQAQAFLGSLLHIRPILTVVEGEVAPLERARTRSKAIQRLVDLLEVHAQGRPLGHVGVGHAEAEADGQALMKMVQQRFPVDQLLFAEIGPVIGTYVGPGAVAITFHCN
jgi:DegV family protein with EDD domain